MTQTGETMTYVSAGHIILTPTQTSGQRAATEGMEPHKQTKQEKRRAERNWKKAGLRVHKHIYLYQGKKNIEIFVKTLKDIFIIPSSKLSRTVESCFRLPGSSLGKRGNP